MSERPRRFDVPPASDPTYDTASTATLVHTIVNRFLVFGMNAVTGIVTARLLSPSGRGELAAISLWPLLMAGVTTFGIQSALIYHGRRTPEQLSDLVASSMTLAVVTGAIGTVVAWFFMPIWLQQHPTWVIRAAQYCLFGTVVNSLNLTGRAAWEARGDFRSSNLSQLFSPALTIVSLAVLWAGGWLTPATAAAAYVAAGLPVLGWMLVALHRRHGPPFRWVPVLWRRLLHYGARSYGVDLFGVLSIYLDQALVVGMLAPHIVGIYAVAISLSKIVSAVHGSVATIMFPRVVGLEPGALTDAIARSARLGALVTGAIGIAIVVAGPALVRLLYGADYDPVGPLLPILVLQVVLAGIGQVLLQGLLAAGRPAAAAVNQFVALGLSVPFFLVLVPSLGARGAAIALLASTAIRMVLTMLCYPLYLRTPMPRIWIGRSDFADLSNYAMSWARTLPFVRLRVGEAE